MSFKVIMVTGPRRSGKSSLISMLVDEICISQPHFIRLTSLRDGKRAPRLAATPQDSCGVASARWVSYDAHRVFETLSTVLTDIHRDHRGACVIIEADTDPNLRHAYPYDEQIFTMPAPDEVESVFRSLDQTKAALQSALHDTSAFAHEIYGLPDSDDSRTGRTTDDRPDMTDTQMLALLRTPLGHELATRVQCQPAYHGLVESDVIVVNTGVGGTSPAVDEVVGRLERLVAQSCERDRGPEIFCCDTCDCEDPRRQQLLRRLQRCYHRESADDV